MVERAVDENDEVNFEIVDDGPAAAEKLAVRKARYSRSSIAENKAKDAVVPLAKRRFFGLRETAIQEADRAKERASRIKFGPSEKIYGNANGRSKRPVDAERPPEDTAAFLARRRKVARDRAIRSPRQSPPRY